MPLRIIMNIKKYPRKNSKYSYINIDCEKCIGCGTCEALSPEIFKLNAKSKAEVIDADKLDDEQLEETIKSCPTEAIELKEKNS